MPKKKKRGAARKRRGKGRKKKGRKKKNVGIFPDRDSMSQFARDNLHVSNWLMSARTIFQHRHKMDLECKEIAKKMRQQANEAGQGNEEELESRIQNAIEKHKDENYEMFDSEIDSESEESENEAEINIYKKPNMIKRWGLPRLYNEHAKPDSREQKYTNSSLYHPNFDQSNLIIESKGNAILGGGFAIFRPAVSIGLYKDKNWPRMGLGTRVFLDPTTWDHPYANSCLIRLR